MEFSRQEYWSGQTLQGIVSIQWWTQVSHIAGTFFTVWAISTSYTMSYILAILLSYTLRRPGLNLIISSKIILQPVE